jgi:hypothetical protein
VHLQALGTCRPPFGALPCIHSDHNSELRALIGQLFQNPSSKFTPSSAVPAGTGNVYPPFPAYTGPRILDYTQSAELDAQFFFSGTPWEMVGRNYTAQTLNLANGGNLTQYDVTSEPSFPGCTVKIM